MAPKNMMDIIRRGDIRALKNEGLDQDTVDYAMDRPRRVRLAVIDAIRNGEIGTDAKAVRSKIDELFEGEKKNEK